ncbi:MAG: class I SAM-dependent methyltransferase [Myxococcota bacterium]
MTEGRRARGRGQAAMEWPPLVRIYESRLWRRNPLFALATGIPFARERALIEAAANLAGHERVLDLACGPGIYARRFAGAVPRGSVVGLDLSMPMLREAASLTRAEGLRNLHLLRGSAMMLPFAAGRFDLVNCCGALHLFPDARGALREIARVLAPGGRFTVAAFRRRPGPLAAWASRRRRRFWGLEEFTAEQLSRWMEEVGLSGPRCLHAAGVWLIMSAVREPSSNGRPTPTRV